MDGYSAEFLSRARPARGVANERGRGALGLGRRGLRCKLVHAPQMVASWVNKFGWPENLMTPVALIEIACAILFAIPRTAVLGAIFVASYFGAAFASHLRVGEGGAGVVPILLAVLAWLGLYLRDERLRVLLPLRTVWREPVRMAPSSSRARDASS